MFLILNTPETPKRVQLTNDIFPIDPKSAIIGAMKVLIACVLGVAGLLALRSVLHEGFRQTITSATRDRAAECLSLAGSTTREEKGFTYIVGSVRNRCETRFTNVTVAFKLDRSDTKITLPDAPILAYAKDVKPGETKEFKTAYHIDKKTTYRFDKITAF